MNKCDQGIHDIVREIEAESKKGSCDSCKKVIPLNQGYIRVGLTNIYKRQNYDKGLTLSYLLSRIKEQFTEYEKQYIQILNTTIDDIHFFK